MAYFANMNQLYINLYPEGDATTYKLVTDITTRVTASKEVMANQFLFDDYTIIDGETPELLSDKIYGTVDYHWVIMLCNDIIDPVYDWIIPHDILMLHIIDTYGESKIYDVHHYEDNDGNWIQPFKSDGSLKDQYTVKDFVGITNLNYEMTKNEARRKIKILQAKYLSQFVEEAALKLRTQGF